MCCSIGISLSRTLLSHKTERERARAKVFQLSKFAAYTYFFAEMSSAQEDTVSTILSFVAPLFNKLGALETADVLGISKKNLDTECA